MDSSAPQPRYSTELETIDTFRIALFTLCQAMRCTRLSGGGRCAYVEMLVFRGSGRRALEHCSLVGAEHGGKSVMWARDGCVMEMSLVLPMSVIAYAA